MDWKSSNMSNVALIGGSNLWDMLTSYLQNLAKFSLYYLVTS